MSHTPTRQWNTQQISKFEKESGQALLRDEQTLVSFSQDFGRLIQSSPAAVYAPDSLNHIEHLILFANEHKLPITIRANGLSQCGQSLPTPGGLTLSMQHFSKPLDLEQDTIWVEANTTWADLLELSLRESKAPYVVPYNCNLSVGGVISVGGVGASSFKYGFINAYVVALEVIDGLGQRQIVDKSSALFHACLSGQGRCAVITKVQMKVRTVHPRVKTFCLVYSSEQDWFADIEKVKEKVDYLELFTSPSMQGTKLQGGVRVPLAQWLYGMHLSVECDEDSPKLEDIVGDLQYWNVLSIQEESMSSYLLRHNPRFDVMKMLGQWDLFHPWYECFVPTKVLEKELSNIVQNLPIHYASFVHVVPIVGNKADLLMFPESDSVCSFMILNPGVPSSLKDSCLQAIKELDAFFMQNGGKRYLSGYLGEDVSEEYWIKHFGDQHQTWMNVKKQYDPQGIFSSMLHRAR